MPLGNMPSDTRYIEKKILPTRLFENRPRAYFLSFSVDFVTGWFFAMIVPIPINYICILNFYLHSNLYLHSKFKMFSCRLKIFYNYTRKAAHIFKTIRLCAWTSIFNYIKTILLLAAAVQGGRCSLQPPVYRSMYGRARLDPQTANNGSCNVSLHEYFILGKQCKLVGTYC